MSDQDDPKPQHLADDDPPIVWNWRQENPVEIVLVAFILILFFSLPRVGCGVEKADGTRIPTHFQQKSAQP